MRKGSLVRFVLITILVGACVQSTLAQRSQATPSKFKLTIPSFPDGGKIPTRFSCADANAGSPLLKWSNPPPGTETFAVIMHDLDTAPDQDSMDVTHWIFWDVTADVRSIGPDVKPGTSPYMMRQGKSFRDVNGYLPACPAPGAVAHHYVTEIYALNIKLVLPAGSTRTELLQAMNGHVIGKSAYIGTFQR